MARLVFGSYMRHPRRWSARQVCFVLVSAITLMYLALYHPYWVRGGDSELYLAIARHLARGEGYRYNGQPVALVPPGWPLLLAGGMWLTSNIAILKLILIGSLLVFFASAFHVLRRYATPWWSAAAVLAVAICQPTWQLSMWFLAEAPFLAASWLALVLVIQAREEHTAGRVGWPFCWRLAAALTLLSVSISLRWTGALWAAMLALALLDGRQIARLNSGKSPGFRLWRRGTHRLWLAAGLCLMVSIGTFFVLRQALKVDPALLDPRYSTFESGEYDLINQTGAPTVATYGERLLALPQWVGVLFWNLLARARSVHAIMSFIALLSLVCMCCGLFVGLRRRQWIWLGAVVVWLPVILTWPAAIARYTLPVAPFLFLAAMVGTPAMLRWLDRRATGSKPEHDPVDRRLPWLLRMLPIWLITPAAIMLVGYNLAMFALEAWVARDPVNRYEAGSQRQLIAIGHFLRRNPENHGELAVAAVRAYNDVRYSTLGPRRKVVWLADRPAIDVPHTLAHEPGKPPRLGSAGPPWEPKTRLDNELDPHLLEWLRQRNVRWYLSTMMQYRLIHLPRPSLRPHSDDWRLYEITPAGVRQVDLSGQPMEVLIVPGLEDVSRVGASRDRIPIPYN